MSMNVKYLIATLFVGCSAITCKNVDDFYYSSQVEDLWRLPLIKPYELINLRNSDSTHPATNEWQLDFFQKTEYVGDLFTRVYKINVKNKIIYGYGKGVYKDYFAIDTRINKEYFFDNKKDWNDFLNKNSIDSTNILNAWNTFYEFHRNATLPWEDEIPSSSNSQ